MEKEKTKFEKGDDLGKGRIPDINKIECRDCTWRSEDVPEVGIVGATMGKCMVYDIKPYGIIWLGEHCPYHVKESDVNDEGKEE